MKQHLKNKVFLSFVISYIAVLMIPYALGYVIYNQSISLVTEKVQVAESEALQNHTEMIDYQLSEFESVLKQISYNNDVRTFVNNVNVYQNASHYYAVTRCKRYFETLISNTPMIKNLTVYSHKSKYFLTSKMGEIYKGENEFPNDLLWGISQEDFAKVVEKQVNKYYSFEDLKTGGKRILFVMPIIIADISKPEGIVIAEISGLDQYVDLENKKDENSFVILNEHGQSLGNKPPIIDQMIKKIETDITSTKTSTKILYEDPYLIIYKPSKINDWKYISVVDLNDYLADVRQFKYYVILYALISIGIGIAVAFYLSKRKYKPIENLKIVASNYKKINHGLNDNDYQIIEKSLSSMIDTVDTYTLYFQNQETKNKNWYFNKMIRGWKVNDENEFESIDFVKIKNKIQNNENIIIIYQIDDFTNLFYELGMDLKNNINVKLLEFIIINVLEESFTDLGAANIQFFENRFIVTIVIGEKYNKDDYCQKANIVKELLTKKFGVIGSFAISLTHKGQYGIKLGYDNAVEILEFMKMTGEQNIVRTFESVTVDEGSRPLKFSIEKEKKFINLIFNEDFEEAKNSLITIINEDIVRLKSLQMLKIRLFGMIDKMMYCLMILSERSKYFKCISQSDMEQLLDVSSAAELKKVITILFDKLIDTKNNEDDEGNIKEKTQEIINYIHQNFKDPNLTVSDIASKFDMSVSNLSKFLKKELGQSTLEYIHMSRINETKELLINTEMILADIADEVGYYNYRTLVSWFKKHEGITPTEYRQRPDKSRL